MKPIFAACLIDLLLACGLNNAMGKETDCSLARDPRRCEAMKVAREACGDLQGPAKSACVREAMPPPDCARAPNTVQCQSKQTAAQACKGKHGKSHRKCLREQGETD